MKRKLLLGIASTILALNVNAQVSDVSITVTPQIGYNWFDNKSTVENGTMYGLQAGFGFGKVIELRGIWERSLDLKQNFGKYESDIKNLFPTFNLESRSIKVNRYGGEFKTNLPIGGFSPYLILGTGVQNFETKLASGIKYKNENLYGSGGLGFKISLGERTTLNFEGRGLVYNMNPGSLLYNEGGSSAFDDYINNTNNSTMYNWSAMAGLQFYLGGRTNSDMDALDRAYLNRFSGGLSGTKLTLSPAGSYINFNSKSAYNDTYLLGGIVGLDFSHYAGLQGYYYRATTDEKIQFEFDNLEIYGADFVGKLNVPRGIVPYISVGGGYLNVRDNYKGRSIVNNSGVVTGNMIAKSGYFAKGGVGVSIPFSKYVEIFGSANLMYTMQNQSADVADLQSSNQLYQHSMYTTGLRVKIGKNANTDKAVDKALDRRFEGERTEYDARIAALEQELKEGYKNNDTEKVMSVMQEKKTVDSVNKSSSTKQAQIRLTPAELESLIEKVLNGVDKKSELSVEDRLERIEQLLMMSGQPQQVVIGMDRTTVPVMQQAPNEELLRELKKLKLDLEEQKRNNAVQPVKDTTIILQNSNDQPSNNQGTNTVVKSTYDPSISNLPVGYTPYIGVNFGDLTSFNIGVRRYYDFQNTKIKFAPEAYLAIGNTLGFGISANGILPFATNVNGFTPYGGLGLGAHYLGSDFTFSTNVLGGVAYQLGNGKFTADYTIRGAFRNNQLAIGYRYSF